MVLGKKQLVRQQFEENKAGWKNSFLEGFSQDQNGNPLPWMTYPAIDFLQKNTTKNQNIFEFGCGASTIFFSKLAKKVIGLETNKRWLEIISKKLPQNCQNVEIHLMEDGLQNSLYENFPNNFSEKFDLIIIDSLKRFDCAKNAIQALKPEGAIILDDSERKNYQKIFNFFADQGFQKQDFFGIAPAQLRIKNTTIFRK